MLGCGLVLHCVELWAQSVQVGYIMLSYGAKLVQLGAGLWTRVLHGVALWAEEYVSEFHDDELWTQYATNCMVMSYGLRIYKYIS